MSIDYIKKVNDIPLAASEAVPSSEIDVKLKDLKNRWNDNHGNMQTINNTSAVWAKLATVTYPSGLDGENAIYGKIMLHQYTTTKLSADFSLLFPSGALAICNGNFTSSDIDNIKIGFVIDSTNRTVDLYGYIYGYAYSGIRLYIEDVVRYHGTTVEATVQYYHGSTLISSEPSGIVYCANDNGALQTNIADYVKYQHMNEINHKNVPTSGGKARHWFNYRNGDTDAADSLNKLTDYFFGNRNNSTADVYLHADGFAPRIVNGTNSNVLPFVKFVCTNTGTNKGFIHFKCVFLGTNNDDGMGHVDITVKIRQNTWHALASKCVRIGGGGALNYGSAGNLIYWESGSNFYLGLRPTSYNAKISVYVQYCELNDTATYTIGNFNSEVANLTIQEGDTRDVSKALGLYDSVDNKYMMQFAFNPSSIGNSANAPDTKTYWENLPTTTDNSGRFNCIYNNRDTEYSLIASKSSTTSNNETHSWGSVLRWSYWSPTLEILRCWRDNWRTDDWEPIAQPSVLCFTYTDTSSGMASLFAALCKCINHTMGGSSSEIRYDMTVLYKGGYFYPLIYFNKAGSGGNYQYMWRFANTGVYGINMITQLVFTVVVPSSGTTTYSWSTESETRWKQQVGSIGTDPQTIYFT